MPGCFDCRFYFAEKNLCLAWGTVPATARRYPHLCGPGATTFRPIIMVPRPPTKKDEMYKSENPNVFDY